MRKFKTYVVVLIPASCVPCCPIATPSVASPSVPAGLSFGMALSDGTNRDTCLRMMLWSSLLVTPCLQMKGFIGGGV